MLLLWIEELSVMQWVPILSCAMQEECCREAEVGHGGEWRTEQRRLRRWNDQRMIDDAAVAQAITIVSSNNAVEVVRSCESLTYDAIRNEAVLECPLNAQE